MSNDFFKTFSYILHYTHKTPLVLIMITWLIIIKLLLLPSAVVIYYCELSNSHKHYDSSLLVCVIKYWRKRSTKAMETWPRPHRSRKPCSESEQTKFITAMILSNIWLNYWVAHGMFSKSIQKKHNYYNYVCIQFRFSFIWHKKVYPQQNVFESDACKCSLKPSVSSNYLKTNIKIN